MSIKEDFEQYPCYLYRNKKLIPVEAPESWSVMFQMHHFIRQNIKKTNKDFFERVKHLQKLILIPRDMHYDLHAMGEVNFFKKYGIDKNLLLFSRLKWREGFYDK